MSELQKTTGADDIVVDPEQLRKALAEIKTAGTMSKAAKETPPACEAVANMLERVHQVGKKVLERTKELIEPLREAIWISVQGLRRASQVIHLLPGFIKDIRRAHRLNDDKRRSLATFIQTFIQRLPKSGVRLRLA